MIVVALQDKARHSSSGGFVAARNALTDRLDFEIGEFGGQRGEGE